MTLDYRLCTDDKIRILLFLFKSKEVLWSSGTQVRIIMTNTLFCFSLLSFSLSPFLEH